jgi:hypothetical protein
MNFKKTISLFACFFLTACATRINHPTVPLQQQSTVEQFQLDENESRIHFFLGEVFMKNSRGIKINEAAELYVNNVKIGLIGNDKEYIAIDLNPGLYNFKWMPVGSGSGYCEPEPLQLSISHNELIFLKANMRDASTTAPGAMLFGAIGALVGTNIKIITYFEPDSGLKGKIKEFKLISLNQSFKQAYSIKKLKIDLPSAENSRSAGLEKKLSELKSIYEKGLITKEEYDEKRKKIIEKY